MYLPPVLRPVAARGVPTSALPGLADAPFSVVRGVPGSYAAERLAGVIDGWQRLGDCVWLRAADARPMELRRSLLAACRYRWSSVELSPGSAAVSDGGLSESFERAPEGAVVVIELGGRVTSGVTRLISSVRPAITARGLRMVVVAESRMHPPVPHGPDCVVPASELLDRRVPADSASDGTWQRLVRHSGKHWAVIDDVRAAALVWSQEPVDEAVDSAHGFPTLLAGLTRRLLDGLTPDQRNALEVASTIGYWHPQMGTNPVPPDQLRPWLVPMEQQWGWVRPIWLPALRRELARTAGTQHQVIGGHLADAVSGSLAATAAPRPAPARVGAPQALLEARLLGSLDVRVDGVSVPAWQGQRGMSVLRFMLFRRRHGCARDELLEEFWPDVSVPAARNRLQVSISALRRAFLAVTPLNIVEYAEGGYRINPDLTVVVDVEGFDRALRAAGAAERRADRDAARSAYRRAVGMYRGDFASDVPFEQWTLLPRESLRLQLVDALDRLSRLELVDGLMDDCIATAHRMLDVDPCREDAHRLLMRCYARQGRTYQAVRQYEFCTRILRVTIDASPAHNTTALYEAIRGSTTWGPSRTP